MTIEHLQRRLRQKVKIRDDCWKRRQEHLKKADQELQNVFKYDQDVVRLLCEIDYRKERE